MTLTKPVVTYAEDVHTYQWEEDGITAVLERFQEAKEDIRAELTISSSHPTTGGQLYFGRLLLMGPQSRAMVRTALEKRDPAPDWGGMLEQIVTISLKRYREGPPAVDLWQDNLGGAGRYLVRPFIFDDSVNLVYGSGDSGKSLLTLLLAIVVASGREVAGIQPERSGPVLYLDWEDSAATHQERLYGLCNAAGVVLDAGKVMYRRMDASLKESAREIRKDIAAAGAAMVIIDSLGMACGGDPSDAGGIIQAMLAARSLGVPVVAIHHIAKEAKDKTTPYGSVYASNEARMSWYVESERFESDLTMVLTNYKSNRGARHERQSFKFSFTESDREEILRIVVTPLTFSASKEIGTGGQKYKIAEWLKSHGANDTLTIAQGVDIPAATVRSVLNRGEGTMFVRTGIGWGLFMTAEVETPF